MNDEQKSLNLAEKLMAARVSKRLSQPELAAKSDIPQSQISKLERAQVADPGFWTVVQLAKTLGLSIDELSNPEVDYRGLKSLRPLYPSRQLVIENPHRPEKGLIALGALDADDASEHYIGMRNAELDRHMLITGRTGAGKSVLIKQMIRDVARTDYATIVIDPHGAMADDVILDLLANVEGAKDRLVVLDFGADDIPGLNPLIVRDKEDIEPRIHSLMSVFSKQFNLSGHAAPRATNYLQQALTALIEANFYLKDSSQQLSILDVPTFFMDAQFRHMVLQFCSNPTIREAYDPENGPYEMLSDKKRLEHVMPTLRVFQPFGNSKLMINALTATKEHVDFTSLIKEGKIVICKLSRFSHQKPFATFLGGLITNLITENVHKWGRQRDPETQKPIGRGCRLFIDEAHSVVWNDDGIVEILAEARKWDFGVVFSTQFVEQFSKPVMDALLANTGSKISFALDPAVAELVTRGLDGGTDLLDKNALSQLPNYRGYGNILIGEKDSTVRSGPFLIKFLPPQTNTFKDHKDAIKKLYAQSAALAENVERNHRLTDIKSELSKSIQERLGLSDEKDDDDNDDDFWGGVLAKI